MKRFIRYLYEYEQAKRIRNVGFVKVEAGDGETIVHMQGKGFHKSDDRRLVLYLFYEENGRLVVIRQNEMELKTPVVNWHFRYTADMVAENYDLINGIMIETDGGRRFAATWDDRPVDVSRMVEMPGGPAVDEAEMRGGPAVVRKEEISGPESTRTLTKIQRKDISRLPRCEWKLANNQFLMHGFNNYHHLILIEEGNDLKLGVPGIYHIEEAKIADRFGFGEFLPLEETDISLDKEERHLSEPFGYWCHPVRRRRTEQKNIC